MDFLVRAVLRVVDVLVGVIIMLGRILSSLLRALARFLVGAHDFLLARWHLRGGVLHCPAGHLVPTEGGTYECAACNYVYNGKGSIWICGNVECRAVTPFINCPDCGLSCRNPYRWGRP